MPYVVLRHLAVRPDFAPGDRPQFLFSFRLSGKSGASQAVARPKISAADHSHVVARAAPNRGNGSYLRPLRYDRLLVTVKVILWNFFQWSKELDLVATVLIFSPPNSRSG